jgi:IPT/TIG domain
MPTAPPAHDVYYYPENHVSLKTPAQTKAEVEAAVAAAQQAYKLDDISTLVAFRSFTGQTTPAPTITTLTPSTAEHGAGEFDVVVTGTNFQPWSIVLWNGAPRPTIYTSPTSLTVKAPSVLSAGVVPVRVTSGGDLVSSASNFTFT